MTRRYFRLGFLVYWLAFVILTAYLGQFPGLTLHPELWKYPFVAVVTVFMLLALMLAVLFAILSPTTFPLSWRRVLFSVAFCIALVLLAASSFGTDLPGYYYAPAIFAIVTLVIVLVLAVVSVVYTLRSSTRNAA